MVANVFRVVAGALLISVAASDAAAQRGQQAEPRRHGHRCHGCRAGRCAAHHQQSATDRGPQTTESDATGLYRFPALLPGAYALTAMHPGFERLERSGIELPVGIAVTVDVRLRLTPVETRVDVEGVVPAIDVQSSSSPATIERALLENLPTPLEPIDRRRRRAGARLDQGRGVWWSGARDARLRGRHVEQRPHDWIPGHESEHQLARLDAGRVGRRARRVRREHQRAHQPRHAVGIESTVGTRRVLVDAQPLDDMGRRAVRVVEHRRAGRRANRAGSGLVLHRRRLLTEHLPAFWIPRPRSPRAWRAGDRRPPAEAAAQAVRGARAGDAARRVRRAA